MTGGMQVFDVSHIHNKHWRDFCDVCYPRFGFESDEERSYEQKYETFCRCKLYITEEKDYEQQLTKTKKEDIEQLKQIVEVFYNLRDARYMIPSLYALVSICETVIENIRSDIELARYVCPRKSLLHFEDLHIKPSLDYSDDVLNNTKIDDVTDPIMRQIMDSVDIPPYVNGYSISEGTKKCARRHISLYENALQDLESLSPSNNKCAKGSELKAFLFRLFMSYEDSLPDIKEQLEELPSPINLQELKNEGLRLVSEFSNSPLGERWVTCMKLNDGLKHFAIYFMHHRNDFTEEDEQSFFYALDKICIIKDIIQGNADKYWLCLQYPDEWLKSNENSIVMDGLLVDDMTSSSGSPSTPIYLNSIFKQKVFNTNAKVVRLRDAIGAGIKGAKLTDGSGLAEDRSQIDPAMQNEWYYVWKIIAESGLLNRKVTVRNFIVQMLEWFPEVFEVMANEEQKKSFIEKMEKSISREKSKWMQGGQEVPFKDMMSKWPDLQLDYNKVKQMFRVCKDLYHALQNLKSSIEQEEAAKSRKFRSVQGQ